MLNVQDIKKHETIYKIVKRISDIVSDKSLSDMCLKIIKEEDILEIDTIILNLMPYFSIQDMKYKSEDDGVGAIDYMGKKIIDLQTFISGSFIFGYKIDDDFKKYSFWKESIYMIGIVFNSLIEENPECIADNLYPTVYDEIQQIPENIDQEMPDMLDIGPMVFDKKSSKLTFTAGFTI